MSAVFVVDTRYMRYTDSSFRLTVKRDAQTRTQLTTVTHTDSS